MRATQPYPDFVIVNPPPGSRIQSREKICLGIKTGVLLQSPVDVMQTVVENTQLLVNDEQLPRHVYVGYNIPKEHSKGS
jgi:hypothetical protein